LPEILKHLKKHGECLDSDIVKATGVSLDDVRATVTQLMAAGEVITCKLTTFRNGKPTEGWLCRVSGYIPPAAPGRKKNGLVLS
jgi:transcription initiation factor IIE alpha subunit